MKERDDDRIEARLQMQAIEIDSFDASTAVEFAENEVIVLQKRVQSLEQENRQVRADLRSY